MVAYSNVPGKGLAACRARFTSQGQTNEPVLQARVQMEELKKTWLWTLCLDDHLLKHSSNKAGSNMVRKKVYIRGCVTLRASIEAPSEPVIFTKRVDQPNIKQGPKEKGLGASVPPRGAVGGQRGRRAFLSFSNEITRNAVSVNELASVPSSKRCMWKRIRKFTPKVHAWFVI